MTAQLSAERDAPAQQVGRRDRSITVSLSVYAAVLFVFPADVVLRVVGGQGYVAGLVSLGLFAGWVVSSLFGLHRPDQVRHPTRGAVAFFAITGLVCWALTPFHGLDGTQQLGADRWILMICGIAGVVCMSAEGLRTVQALFTVVRVAVWGAAFCAFVAVLQWLVSIDLSGVLRQALPGFSANASFNVYEARGALSRVYGTSTHPIELGVVAGMLLPLAVVVALHDTTQVAWRRWLPVLLIALAVPASVSRSGVLSAAVSMLVLILSMPARRRLIALVVVPVGALILGLARPGYLSTLAEFVGAGSNDTSVATRLDDYPMVARMVGQRPWFGTGGGTYVPDNLIDVLDNQYLKSAIELGFIGITGLLVYFLVPVAAALSARRRSQDPLLRALAGALAGAGLAAAVCAVTFDALSFNMFVGVQSLVIGCSGACWVLSRTRSAAHLPQSPGS